MANEQRIRSQLNFGTISDNPLTTTTTVINSPAFAALPAITSSQHLVLALNPTEAAVPGTNAEVVYVTAHTSGATGVTVVRAREGTTASGFNSTATWVSGPTIADHAPNIVSTVGSLPSSGGLPFEGELAWIMDTNKLVAYNGSAWVDVYNGDAWTAFTPTFQSGTGWAVGNASMTGTYIKVGRLVVAKIGILIGSTTTKGSGTLSIGGLPYSNITPSAVCFANFHKANNNADYPGEWLVGANVNYGELRSFAASGAAVLLGPVTATFPFTWTTSDAIEATLVYEASA